MTSILATGGQGISTGAGVTATEPGSDGGGKMFAAVSAQQTASAWTMESGWSQIAGGASSGSAMFQNPGDGTEDGASTATRTGNTSGVAGLMIARLDGAGTVEGASVGDATGSPVVSPAITGLPAGTYFVLHFAIKMGTGAATWTAPATATRRTSAGQVLSGTGLPFAIADEVVDLPSGGTIAARTWTQSTGLSFVRSFMIAIKVPGGGGPTGLKLSFYNGTTEVEHKLFWYNGTTEVEHKLTEVST